MLRAIDHVQRATPASGESLARRFYGERLGRGELPKPPKLAARSGAWFGHGAVPWHLGVEADFRPARQAPAGLQVDHLSGLLGLRRTHGVGIREGAELPGYRHAHVDDPFGNRIELMQSLSFS